MVRPTVPIDKQKKSVSMSLSREALVILDNLATRTNRTRSSVIEEMIKAKGFKDLGLKATEKHVSSLQKWNGEKTRDSGACNPHHVNGLCKHHACEAVYKKEGLL